MPSYKVQHATGIVAADQVNYGGPQGMHGDYRAQTPYFGSDYRTPVKFYGNTAEAMHYRTPGMGMLCGDYTTGTYTIMGKAYPKSEVYIVGAVAAVAAYMLLKKKSRRRR